MRDTVIYYRNFRHSDLFGKTEGYTKNGVIYATKYLTDASSSKLEAMVYEEDFADITAEDYKKMATDYIAVYKWKSSSVFSDIVSYRRYDGVYFPTAPSYRSLFKLL